MTQRRSEPLAVRYSSYLPGRACNGHCGIQDGSDHLHLDSSLYDLLSSIQLLVRTVWGAQRRSSTSAAVA